MTAALQLASGFLFFLLIGFEMIYQTQVPTMAIPSGYNQFGWFDHILALPNFYPQIPVYDEEGWNVEIAPSSGDSTKFTTTGH